MRQLVAGLIIFTAALSGCGSVGEPALPIDGTYVLVAVSGKGPASGALVLTRKGYAELRVRFLEPDSSISTEYLTRGTVAIQADSTLLIALWVPGRSATDPWIPEARWRGDVVELRYDDNVGGQVTEVYQRKQPFPAGGQAPN